MKLLPQTDVRLLHFVVAVMVIACLAIPYIASATEHLPIRLRPPGCRLRSQNQEATGLLPFAGEECRPEIGQRDYIPTIQRFLEPILTQ